MNYMIYTVYMESMMYSFSENMMYSVGRLVRSGPQAGGVAGPGPAEALTDSEGHSAVASHELLAAGRMVRGYRWMGCMARREDGSVGCIGKSINRWG
jgi:hypothetical protein